MICLLRTTHLITGQTCERVPDASSYSGSSAACIFGPVHSSARRRLFGLSEQGKPESRPESNSWVASFNNRNLSSRGGMKLGLTQTKK